MTRPNITPGEWLCAGRIVYALNEQPGRNQCNRMTLTVGHGHDDNGKHITNEECEADATAIAALPDLLAALERSLTALTEAAWGASSKHEKAALLNEAEQVKSALIKAGYTF